MVGGAVTHAREWFGAVPRGNWTPDRADSYRDQQIRRMRREIALAPDPMTANQVRDLVERVRSKGTPTSRANRVATAKRWERYRRLKLADIEEMQRRAAL